MVGSKPSTDGSVQPSDNLEFSDLEVVARKEWLEHDEDALPIVGRDPREERIHNDSEGKFVRYNLGKHVLHSELGKEVIEVYNPYRESLPVEAKTEQKICGIRRKPALIIGAIIILVIVSSVAGVVGCVLGLRARSHAHSTPSENATTSNTSYRNTGLAALQWSANGTLHKRLYYQDSLQQIQESAWDNNTAFNGAWTISTVSHSVKPETPLAALAGYISANVTLGLAKNVYFQTVDNGLSALQDLGLGPPSWAADAINGIFRTLNATFLAAYINEDVQTVSHDLIVIFQGDGYSASLSQARRSFSPGKSYNWGSETFGFPHAEGATFALAPADYRNGSHIMLYSVDENNLCQHDYTIGHDRPVRNAAINVTSSNSTGPIVAPQAPLAVVPQDNRPLFSPNQLPECTLNLPLTHLILYTVPDRSSLALNVWNCSSGYVDHTPDIAPLQRTNTTFLSIAALTDKNGGQGNFYIMFDSGSGPQVEEWTVPALAGEPWTTRRNVTVDFAI